MKKITGLQFSPVDPNILMATSADSRVRIIRGHEVICKFQGLQKSSSQLFASFTSDGKRVVSVSEDSNVYVWNFVNEGRPMSKPNKILFCEHFSSNNASVVVPWLGLLNISGELAFPTQSFSPLKYTEDKDFLHSELGESSRHQSPFSSPEHISMRHGFFSESLPRGSATWPEEKLPPPSSSIIPPSTTKSHNKSLKAYFQSTLNSSHVWGLSIVTAGWDGRIRSFQNLELPHRN